MPPIGEGDKVRIVLGDVSEADQEIHSLHSHLDGLEGVVESRYSDDEIAVKIDLETLPKVPGQVHTESTKRMRAKFLEAISEDQKKTLTKEELKFVPHYVVLVRDKDLKKV